MFTFTELQRISYIFYPSESLRDEGCVSTLRGIDGNEHKWAILAYIFYMLIFFCFDINIVFHCVTLHQVKAVTVYKDISINCTYLRVDILSNSINKLNSKGF